MEYEVWEGPNIRTFVQEFPNEKHIMYVDVANECNHSVSIRDGKVIAEGWGSKAKGDWDEINLEGLIGELLNSGYVEVKSQL